MIRYAKKNNTLVLRFCDEVRYTHCGPLQSLLDDTFAKGEVDNIIIDLTRATSIDSTGLGLLARISNHIQGQFHHRTPIFTTNPDIDRSLDAVGFGEIFLLLHHHPGESAQEQALPEAALSDRATAAMVLEAHRCLASLSEENWQQFGDVVSALEAELHGGKTPNN